MAKKEKNEKNYGGAKAFSERKQGGRSKQVWVWDVPPQPREETPNGVVAAHPGIGHWEKAAE